MKLSIEEIMSYMPKDVTDADLLPYINKKLFKDHHFLFIKSSKATDGYCDNCGKMVKLSEITERIEHNCKVKCPACHRCVRIKNEAVGYRRLRTKGYFIKFFKSAKDENAITAESFLIFRDYWDWKNNKYSENTEIIPKHFYLFIPGKGGFGVRGHYNPYYGESYENMRQITPSVPQGGLYDPWRGVVGVDKKSLFDVIKDTPLKYNAYKDYFKWWNTADEYIVSYLANAAKYPALEYLEKLGMKDIAFDKNISLGSLFNMRGKTIKTVFGFKPDKKDWAYIRKDNEKAEQYIPIWRKVNKTEKKYYHLEDFENMLLEQMVSLIAVMKLLKYMKFEQINKVYQKYSIEYEKRKIGKTMIMSDYVDYLNDCKKLGMDMKDKYVLLPKSLLKAHQNTIKQVRFKENEALNKKMMARIQSLTKKYSFIYQGLMIVVPRLVSDLVLEGKAMHNCVGTYAQRHANKQTTILFIRRVSDPTKSYHTLEITNNQIIQCRSFANNNKTKNVEKFLKKFKEERLDKHIRVKTITAGEFVRGRITV